MAETIGILMAMASSAIGGTSAAFIRFMVGSTDPIALSALRFGLGFFALMPVTLMLKSRWPSGRDWISVIALGILFFGLCFVLYNRALSYTTAARGALAISTLPLMTMLAGAILRVERLTYRKSLGVLIAIGGAAAALATGLEEAPNGAWRGDLIMLAAAVCYSLYNVWSRPFIATSSPLAYTTATMGAGALSVTLLAWAEGGFAVVASYGRTEWPAILYLGTVGSALSSYLWISALQRTTPTRVASTSTLNPVTAAALAAVILAEPVGFNILAGIGAVLAGIWIASTEARARSQPRAEVAVPHQADDWNMWRAGYGLDPRDRSRR